MTAVAWVCGAMLAAAAFLTSVHAIRARNLPERAIGLDMLVAVVLNGLAVAIAISQDDVVAVLLLVISVLGFLGTVTVARYLEQRES